MTEPSEMKTSRFLAICFFAVTGLSVGSPPAHENTRNPKALSFPSKSGEIKIEIKPAVPINIGPRVEPALVSTVKVTNSIGELYGEFPMAIDSDSDPVEIVALNSEGNFLAILYRQDISGRFGTLGGKMGLLFDYHYVLFGRGTATKLKDSGLLRLPKSGAKDGSLDYVCQMPLRWLSYNKEIVESARSGKPLLWKVEMTSPLVIEGILESPAGKRHHKMEFSLQGCVLDGKPLACGLISPAEVKDWVKNWIENPDILGSPQDSFAPPTRLLHDFGSLESMLEFFRPYAENPTQFATFTQNVRGFLAKEAEKDAEYLRTRKPATSFEDQQKLAKEELAKYLEEKNKLLEQRHRLEYERRLRERAKAREDDDVIEEPAE